LAFSLPLACAYLFNLAGDSTCKNSSYFIWYKFKNKTFLANIEINDYICKRKTLLSLLNKQTSGLLFLYALMATAEQLCCLWAKSNLLSFSPPRYLKRIGKNNSFLA
jgi:hypothetical protein